MTPAGKRLDRFLSDTIAAFKCPERSMPEVGGKRLASGFSAMMADVRKSIDAAGAKVAAAVTELKTEIEAGADNAAKALRAEAAEVRRDYGELLGNNPPASDETKKPGA